jgi:flagellar biosynthesis protein
MIDKKNRAPEVVASGQGFIAEKILEIAAKHQVPFYEHSELVEALSELPAGSEVPPELYELVAQVLAFVLRLDEKQGRDYRGQRDG